MSSDIENKLEEVAGESFTMRIENNEMIITPAEAGVALLAAVSQMNEDDSEGWAEAERLGMVIEDLRTENAEFRDLFEAIHPMLIDFGATEAANRLMRLVYPVYGTTEDGTTIRIGEDE